MFIEGDKIMALKDTINAMKKDLGELCCNLEKAAEGNRAAAQRVRTGTIKFARIAKTYRQESVAAEKKESGKGGKKSLKAKAALKGSKKRKQTGDS
jgi:hypothetical protein